MNKLTDEERACIEVHGFGGIVTIPNKLAAKAVNHFNDGDIIGQDGNAVFDPNNTIRNCIKIKKRMQLRSIGLRCAIKDRVKKEIRKGLNPHNLSKDIAKEVRDAKINKFGATYFGGVKLSNEEVDPVVQKYVRCFSDYTIDWKPSSLAITSPRSDDDLSDLSEEVINDEITGVTDSNRECHILQSFSDVIQKIAQEIIVAE